MSEYAEGQKFLAETELLQEKVLTERIHRQRVEAELTAFQEEKRRERSYDLRNRTYNFIGQIDTDSVQNAAAAIFSWDRESREQITLRLLSPGGDVSSGLFLFDLLSAIVAEGTPVNTIALGAANSMAAVVLQAGSRRVVGPNSWMTLHEISVAVSPFVTRTTTEREEEDATLRKINKRLVKILACKAKVDEAFISKKIRKTDWTIDPEEAISLGLADEIGYR